MSLVAKVDPHVAKLAQEVRTLRLQVSAHQKEKTILDPLRTADVSIGALRKYIQELDGLSLEAWAVRGSNLEAMPPKGGSSEGPMPNPVHSWAQELFRREMRDLARKAARLHEWIERPSPPRRSSRRQCQECGRGLARGHLFCSACGAQVIQVKETNNAT